MKILERAVKIDKLPPDKKKKALEFIDFLLLEEDEAGKKRGLNQKATFDLEDSIKNQ